VYFHRFFYYGIKTGYYETRNLYKTIYVFSIFILFSSCQSKKENDRVDLLQMILKGYDDKESNSKQNCTYINVIHGFEKDIYHFVLSEHSCKEGFLTASYKNKRLYLTEILPLSVENYTDIEFTQKSLYPESEELFEPGGIENFDIKPYFFML